MKTYEEMYGKHTGAFYAPCDYNPILGAIGEIVLQVDDSDYQGDSRVLYKDGDNWGVLFFGWGSCSGCDALQACDSPTEVEELGQQLESSVRWKPQEEMLTWLYEHDWKGDYSWYEEETHKFVAKARAILHGFGVGTEEERMVAADWFEERGQVYEAAILRGQGTRLSS